jgi:hypothetical protein
VTLIFIPSTLHSILIKHVVSDHLYIKSEELSASSNKGQ